MPELEITPSQQPEIPPVALMGVMGASTRKLPKYTSEVTEQEMAEQVRRLLAYVLQTPEGEHDTEIWMKGFNYKKLAAFANEEMDRNGKVPFVILYVLDHFWKSVAGSRERIGMALRIGKDTETGEFPATFPAEPNIDDDNWLENYRTTLMPESEGLTRESANDLIVSHGRETAIEVVLGVLKKNRPLRDDEKNAISNMAQTITSAEVMNAILPLAEEDPWIGINLLNNLALVRPHQRIERLASKVDFTRVVKNLIEASKEDMDIANELAKILENPNIGSIITQIKFDQVAQSIMSDPINHPNMCMALLEHPDFDMEAIGKLATKVTHAYEDGECKEKCRDILIEISGYLSKSVNKIIDRVYKEVAITTHRHKENLKEIVSTEDVNSCHMVIKISNILDRVDGVNLCKKAIGEAAKALIFLKNRGSKRLLNEYCTRYPFSDNAEILPSADQQITQISDQPVKPALDPHLFRKNGKPKRRSDREDRGRRPRKAITAQKRKERREQQDKRGQSNGTKK